MFTSVAIIHRLQTYVAECVGVHAVGYAIMIYGLGSSLGSCVTGKLLALEEKFYVVLAALSLHLAIFSLLLIWEREPILSILLTIPFLYGICDGTWMTVCSSKCMCTMSCMHLFTCNKTSILKFIYVHVNLFTQF